MKVDTGDVGFDTSDPSRRPRGVPDRPRRLVRRFDRSDRRTQRLRTMIADHCAGRVDADTIDSVQLVASELVTNALDHGRGGVVTIDVTINGPTVAVTVTSTGNTAELPSPESWLTPKPHESSGHGLSIIRTLAHSVEVHRATDTTDELDWIGVTARFES